MISLILAARRCRGALGAGLLALASASCADATASADTAPRFAPEPLNWELHPVQARLLSARPSARVPLGRPATRADLEEVRSWFGPGELEAILAVVNRHARARGADTIPHCLPLCDAAPAAEPAP